MGTRAFWLGTLDRAGKTFATTLLPLLAGGSSAFNVLHVDWPAALAVSAGSVVVSVLLSLASSQVGDPGTTAAIPGAH